MVQVKLIFIKFLTDEHVKWTFSKFRIKLHIKWAFGTSMVYLKRICLNFRTRTVHLRWTCSNGTCKEL